MTGNQPGERWDAEDYEDQEARKCKACGEWDICRADCPGEEDEQGGDGTVSL